MPVAPKTVAPKAEPKNNGPILIKIKKDYSGEIRTKEVFPKEWKRLQSLPKSKIPGKENLSWGWEKY